jgi:hypothetical protein
VNDPIGQLGIEEIPMIGPPASKHGGGHQAPRTEAEKRRAAKRRRAQLLAPVQVTHKPMPVPVCGHRWRNASGARRRCCLPAHDIVDVAHRDRSRANAWDPRREAEVAKRAGRVAAAVKQDIENGLVARDAAPEGGGS